MLPGQVAQAWREIMSGRSRSVDIYNTLYNRIITWKYPPGQRLTEEEVCGEFGVSRSPVREALNSLVSAHLVTKEEHKGYTVRNIDLRQVNELYDTRAILEIGVVDLICKQGIPQRILESMKEHWKTYAETLPSLGIQAAIEDELFHKTLADVAGNMVMAQMLSDISQQIHFVRLSDISDRERFAQTCKDHLEILDALEARDRERAAESMRKNILWGKEKVDDAIREALFQAHHM
jgi:DNA-binding GntR family transcriptional regulator